MASSKGSPGPHDRRLPRQRCVKKTKLGKRCTRWAVGREKLCKAHKSQVMVEQALSGQTVTGELPADDPAMNLPDEIDLDFESNKLRAQERTRSSDDAQPTSEGSVRGGTASTVRKEAAKKLAQAEADRKANMQETALARRSSNTPKKPARFSPGNFVVNEQARVVLARLGKPASSSADPRQMLLDTVASAWRQQQVWEQMLAAVPEQDWAFVGMTPIPGSQFSAKGARIEAIQKYLTEATKTAARTSKLAIDAGIEERLVRLAEEQSAMIADTVKAGIISAVRVLVSTLRLKPEQEKVILDQALGEAAQQLRLLAAGAQPDQQQVVVDGQASEVEPRRTFDQPKGA